MHNFQNDYDIVVSSSMFLSVIDYVGLCRALCLLVQDHMTKHYNSPVKVEWELW